VQSASAQGDLDVENELEPFNSGVVLSCVAPGKRYLPIELQSGGEKTMAALAFMIAMRALVHADCF